MQNQIMGLIMNVEGLEVSLVTLLYEPAFYLQLITAFSVIFTAWVISVFLKTYILRKLKKVTAWTVDDKRLALARKYFSSLFIPIFSIIFLALSGAIFQQIFDHAKIILVATEISFMWLIISFIRIFSKSKSLAWVVGVTFVLIVTLKIFGLLHPTIEHLDSFAVEIGDIRLSVYIIFKAIIFVTVIFWLTKLIAVGVKKYISSISDFNLNSKLLLGKSSDIILYTTAFMVMLNIVGIDLTAFAVVGGAVGVGLGIGLQKIASNFISGFILLFEGSIEIGDMVELPDDVNGWVKHLGARGTIIDVGNGKEVIIPNEDLITKNITNWTHSNTKGRIEISLQVPFTADVGRAREIMLLAAKEEIDCMVEPSPSCYITDFTDYGVKIQLYFWVADVRKRRKEIKSDVMERIYNQFRINKIKFADYYGGR